MSTNQTSVTATQSSFRRRAVLIRQGLFATGIFFFAPASSCDGGERNSIGECPFEEECSDKTPDGLLFRGPTIGEAFFDSNGVKTIAVGGTQRIAVSRAESGKRLPVHTATMEGDVGTVTENQDVVQWAGRGPANGFLRIVDQDGLLLDRIALASSMIDSISIAQSLSDSLNHQAGANILFASGGGGVIRLLDTAGNILVDESMIISGSGVLQTGWDSFSITAPTGPRQIRIVSAGTEKAITINVVAPPDRVTNLWTTTELESTTQSFLCFSAFAGPASVHANWTFTVENGTLGSTRLDGCVMATAGQVGTMKVRAQAGTASHDLVLNVTPKRRRASSPATMLSPEMAEHGQVAGGSMEGERAAAQ
jgi:hypothetical protein